MVLVYQQSGVRNTPIIRSNYLIMTADISKKVTETFELRNQIKELDGKRKALDAELVQFLQDKKQTIVHGEGVTAKLVEKEVWDELYTDEQKEKLNDLKSDLSGARKAFQAELEANDVEPMHRYELRVTPKPKEEEKE